MNKMHNRNAGNCHVGPVASTHGPKGRGGPREGRVPSTLVRILLMGGERGICPGCLHSSPAFNYCEKTRFGPVVLCATEALRGLERAVAFARANRASRMTALLPRTHRAQLPHPVMAQGENSQRRKAIYAPSKVMPQRSAGSMEDPAMDNACALQLRLGTVDTGNDS